jgi:hypothetical protein
MVSKPPPPKFGFKLMAMNTVTSDESGNTDRSS